MTTRRNFLKGAAASGDRFLQLRHAGRGPRPAESRPACRSKSAASAS